MPGQGPIPSKQPTQRTINARAAVHALDGPEKSYDVYRFNRKKFFERPQHNPFAVPPAAPEVAYTLAWNPSSTASVWDSGTPMTDDMAIAEPIDFDMIIPASQGGSATSYLTRKTTLDDSTGFLAGFMQQSDVIGNFDYFLTGAIPDGLKSKVRMTATVELFGTYVDDTYSFNVDLIVQDRAAAQAAFHISPYQVTTLTADHYLGATIFKHRSQGPGIVTLAATWEVADVPALATFTDYSWTNNVLWPNIFWLDNTGGTGDDPLNWNIHELLIEFIE